VIHDDRAAFHYPANLADDDVDVGQRIAIDADEIGGPVVSGRRRGGRDCGLDQRLDRRRALGLATPSQLGGGLARYLQRVSGEHIDTRRKLW